MKKYLIILISLFCMNTSAQEPALNSEKPRLTQMQMFESLMADYNKLDEKEKQIYRENIFKVAFNYFDKAKKNNSGNGATLTPSGNSSKFVLTYEDNSAKGLTDYEIGKVSERFTQLVCRTPHLLVLLGAEIPIEYILNLDDKVGITVKFKKEDCTNINFNVK